MNLCSIIVFNLPPFEWRSGDQMIVVRLGKVSASKGWCELCLYDGVLHGNGQTGSSFLSSKWSQPWTWANAPPTDVQVSLQGAVVFVEGCILGSVVFLCPISLWKYAKLNHIEGLSRSVDFFKWNSLDVKFLCNSKTMILKRQTWLQIKIRWIYINKTNSFQLWLLELSRCCSETSHLCVVTLFYWY